MAYSRSVLGGSDEDYSKSVLGGSAEDYSRSVLGGSDEDYSRSVLGGSDEDYSRSVLGGSDKDYSRSVLGGSDKDYSRLLSLCPRIPSTDEEGPDEDYSKYKVEMSEEYTLHKIHCEPCKKDGNTVDAVKHCSDCAEYLCGQCFKSHAKFKAFQNHVTNDVIFVTLVTNSITQLSRLSAALYRQRMSKRTCRLVSSMDTHSSSDKKQPFIQDLTIVRSHYCVVIDDDNKSIKVADTRQMCVVSEIRFTDADALSGITSVNDDQVAVSVAINGVDKLVFFSVSTSGIISHSDRSLDMGTIYPGIIHHNDRFHGSHTNKITIINMSGQIIKTINNHAFGQLYGIALGNDHNTMYVCSWSTDTVFSVDLEGNINATYKDQDLKGPVGVTVDSDENVFVCGIGTKCVHQLTADLKKVQVIISDVGARRCILNRSDNRLYLTSRDTITMYDMKYD